jgi:hypothetical protein
MSRDIVNSQCNYESGNVSSYTGPFGVFVINFLVT